MSSLAYFTASIAFIDYSGTSVSNSPPKISIEAYSGGELLVDGFEYPVVIDFEGLSLRETVPLNVDHNTSLDYLIGQGSPVYADGRLTIPGTITGDNEPTKKVLRLNAAGFKWQASIGAIVDESTLIQAGQKVVINGRMFVGPIVHATKSRLTHCAVLSEGADQTSAVTIAAKLAAKGNRMSFEEWVASLGFDMATLQPPAIEFLKGTYPGETPMVDAAAVTPPEQKPAAVAVLPQFLLQLLPVLRPAFRQYVMRMPLKWFANTRSTRHAPNIRLSQLKPSRKGGRQKRQSLRP